MNKYLYLIAVVATIFVGCKSGSNGELVGVPNRPSWFEPEPTGMVFIPQGHFNMGPNGQDVPFAMNSQPKTVSIDAFWMDATEITNNEYRQFVYWVRDSIAMRLCVKNGVTDFQIQADENSVDPEFYDPTDPNQVHLNWKNRKMLWKDQSPDVKDAIKDLFYSKQDALYGKKQIDTRKLVYEYFYVDLKQAAKKQNRYIYDDLGGTGQLAKGHYEGTIINYDYDNYGKVEDFKNRKSLVQHQKVPIYPDTLVWMADYTYSYNEPYSRQYFSHPAFDDYPVVGINWHQANAFSAWRTKIQNDYNQSQGIPNYEDYRLPTEAEWEYAARGGKDQTIYPWGGPYARNYKGCLLANFKPMRGMYALDGANRTIMVGTYAPNDYGLYDMAGNVAEWTSGAYEESSYSFVHDLNPDYKYNAKKDDPAVLKRKVIRGGSWKDIAYYLQCGVRSYEYQDTAKSYIGFRDVRSYLGKDVSVFEGY